MPPATIWSNASATDRRAFSLLFFLYRFAKRAHQVVRKKIYGKLNISFLKIEIHQQARITHISTQGPHKNWAKLEWLMEQTNGGTRWHRNTRHACLTGYIVVYSKAKRRICIETINFKNLILWVLNFLCVRTPIF